MLLHSEEERDGKENLTSHPVDQQLLGKVLLYDNV